MSARSRGTPRLFAACLAACIAIGLPAPSVLAEQASDKIAPESATGFVSRPPVTARKWMVVAANPHAARTGEAILAQGGNAVDAAIAVAFVQGVVDPQMCGLGGGGFAGWWFGLRTKAARGPSRGPRRVH